MTNEKKNKLFGFFDYNRDNRPDAVEEDTTPTLGRYFKVLGRRFWKLITLNLMMLPLILPVLICFCIISDRRSFAPFWKKETLLSTSMSIRFCAGTTLQSSSEKGRRCTKCFKIPVNIPKTPLGGTDDFPFNGHICKMDEL